MDIKGKVVVITGGTSGLGQAAAVDFAKEGAKVFIVGRDQARANETRQKAKAAGADLEYVLGDVSTKDGARAVARELLGRTQKIDVLLNNAGGSFKQLTRTKDGIETTFALNTLGAWILEKELHGALVTAKGRVVNVATGFLDSFPLAVDELVEPKSFGSNKTYGAAKQASVMMTVEQAARFAPAGVKAVSVHPGIIMGTRFGGGQPPLMQAIAGPILRGIGLATTLQEAVRRFKAACFGDVPSGSYVVKGAPAPLPKQSADPAIRAQVVALLDKLSAA